MSTDRPNPRFGPHTEHVDHLLIALADPEVRRRARRRSIDHVREHEIGRVVYERVRIAGRLDEWDDARSTAAAAATRTQARDAAGAALAIVASDLIDDRSWDHYTNTPLGRLIQLPRPGGPLAERCTCGHQLGQRLLAAKVADADGARWTGITQPCMHTTPSLPTVADVETALSLVATWPHRDWRDLLQIAIRLAP